MSGGTVYILTNASFPDLVKVGFTTRSAKVRAQELSGTGLPHKFEVFYETAEIDNYREVERAVHTTFKADRVNNGREFFRTDADTVRQELINLTCSKPCAPVVTVSIPDNVDEIVLRLERTKLR